LGLSVAVACHRFKHKLCNTAGITVLGFDLNSIDQAESLSKSRSKEEYTKTLKEIYG
jgi:hypothetical protein